MSRGIKTAFDLPPGRIIQAAPASFNVLGYDAGTTLFFPPLHFTLAGGNAAFNLTRQAVTTVSSSSGGSTALPYPISSSILLDSPSGYITSTAGQQAQAKYNYVCLQGNGFQGGTNFASAFSAIKGFAAAGHTVYTGFYTLADSWYPNGTAPADDTPKAKALSGLLAGQSGPFGLGSSSFGTSPFAATGNGIASQVGANYTSACPSMNITAVGSVTGPGSVNWSQFCAWYDYQSLVNGNLAAMGNPTSAFPANSHVDFWYRDNLIVFPITGGYYTPGTNYGSSSNNATLRADAEAGWIQAVAKSHSLQPTQVNGSPVLCGGNFQCFATSNAPVIDTPNAFQIVGFENPVGYSAAFLSFAGFLQRMMFMEGYAVGNRPDYCWFNIECGNPSNGAFNGTFLPNAQSSWSAQNWRSVRYQIGLSLLMRWVVAFQNNNGTSTWWMDEFDAGVSGNGGYLGTPPGSRPVNSSGAYVSFNTASAAAYAAGIWTIPFAGGTGYLYPAATGDTQSGSNITLTSSKLQGGSGKTLTYTVEGGNGPPGIPNNTIVTSITIQPRDFVVLV